MMTTRPDARWLLAAAVLALHALLLSLWPRAAPSQRGAPTPAPAPILPIAARLLPAPPPPPQVSPARPPLRTETPARAASPRPVPSAVAPALPPTAIPAQAPAAPDVATTEPAPLDLRLRLPPEAARRGGLTEPSGSLRAQALNDPRSNRTPDPRRQLPDAVAGSAKGDCLKGEYAGWGMGLLSVPFLAYHVAAGHCKPQR
jgi:hypothetical protein